MELSKIHRLLKHHNVRLVGIGVEAFGAEEFFNGNFFSGELFIDPKKEQYKALGYKRFNICNIWFAIMARVSRQWIKQGRKDKIPSNLAGDGMQNGGMLIVKRGGTEVLYQYKMEELTDHVPNSEILKVLGIDENQSFPGEPKPSRKRVTAIDTDNFTDLSAK